MSGPLVSSSFNAKNGTTTGSCASGNAAGTVTANSGSPATVGSTTLLINSCTDNNSSYDLQQITLNSSPTLNVNGTSATISNPTFTARIIDTSGLVSNCAVRLYPPSAASPTLTGVINNGSPAGGTPTTQPSLTFSNVVAYATASSGPCPQQIGNGTASPAQTTTFSAAFRPLKTSGGLFIGSF